MYECPQRIELESVGLLSLDNRADQSFLQG